MKWGRLGLGNQCPNSYLQLGFQLGDLLCSNLNTWIWQSKAWCQRWQGQDIVQKQLAGMYKLWFLTVFSINIHTAAAPPPSHQPRLLQSHLSSFACNTGKIAAKGLMYPTSIHPSICYLTEGSEEAYQVAITGFQPPVSLAECFMWTLLFWIHFIFIWAIKNYGRENIQISLPLTLSKIWKSNLRRREKQFFLLVKIFHSQRCGSRKKGLRVFGAVDSHKWNPRITLQNYLKSLD